MVFKRLRVNTSCAGNVCTSCAGQVNNVCSKCSASVDGTHRIKSVGSRGVLTECMHQCMLCVLRPDPASLIMSATMLSIIQHKKQCMGSSSHVGRATSSHRRRLMVYGFASAVHLLQPGKDYEMVPRQSGFAACPLETCFC